MVVSDPQVRSSRGKVLEKNTDLHVRIIPTLSPVFAKRKIHRDSSTCGTIWNILDEVCDPELPGLTIWDLGILQNIEYIDESWVITITPTYSGCPAVDSITQDVKNVLSKKGYQQIKVNVVLSPAWTTEMISPAGKAHLKSIQIAPPDKENMVSCPVCESENTEVLSQFGTTACKSLYQCKDCFEAFDYFKHF